MKIIWFNAIISNYMLKPEKNDGLLEGVSTLDVINDPTNMGSYQNQSLPDW